MATVPSGMVAFGVPFDEGIEEAPDVFGDLAGILRAEAAKGSWLPNLESPLQGAPSGFAHEASPAGHRVRA